MTVGFAIGNGISRAGFDLNRLDGRGVTIGCNMIYRHYQPDYIVGLDAEMKTILARYLESGGEKKWKFISRELDSQGRGWITLDGTRLCRINQINDGYNNNSGVMAAGYLAERLKCDTVYMIGIDFFRQVPGKDNDLFSGNAVFAPGIAHVFRRLSRNSPDTNFIRVGEINERDVEFYNSLDGYSFIEYEDFRDRGLS